MYRKGWRPGRDGNRCMTSSTAASSMMTTLRQTFERVSPCHLCIWPYVCLPVCLSFSLCLCLSGFQFPCLSSSYCYCCFDRNLLRKSTSLWARRSKRRPKCILVNFDILPYRYFNITIADVLSASGNVCASITLCFYICIFLTMQYATKWHGFVISTHNTDIDMAMSTWSRLARFV